MDAVTFPSAVLRELAAGGLPWPSGRERRREWEVVGWLETRFAHAVSAQLQGDEAMDTCMIEGELKEIYISAGIVDALRRATGESLSVEDLLQAISRQVRQALGLA